MGQETKGCSFDTSVWEGRSSQNKATPMKCGKVSRNTLDRDPFNFTSLPSALFWFRVVERNISAHSNVYWLLIDTIHMHNVYNRVLNSLCPTTHDYLAVHAEHWEAQQLPRSLHPILSHFPCWSCKVQLPCLGKNMPASKRRKALIQALKN